MSEDPSCRSVWPPSPTLTYPSDAAEEEATITTIHPVFNPHALALDSSHFSPQKIAIKRTRVAKQRLASAHEAWGLITQKLLLHRADIAPDDDAIATELARFGREICGQYAEATLLWRVLEDMPGADWFGKGKGVDVTLRRLNTLKGLEESLRCWEGVLLELMVLVDDDEASKECEKVRRVLEKWKDGLPGEL